MCRNPGNFENEFSSLIKVNRRLDGRKKKRFMMGKESTGFQSDMEILECVRY